MRDLRALLTKLREFDADEGIGADQIQFINWKRAAEIVEVSGNYLEYGLEEVVD